MPASSSPTRRTPAPSKPTIKLRVPHTTSKTCRTATRIFHMVSECACASCPPTSCKSTFLNTYASEELIAFTIAYPDASSCSRASAASMVGKSESKAIRQAKRDFRARVPRAPSFLSHLAQKSDAGRLMGMTATGLMMGVPMSSSATKGLRPVLCGAVVLVALVLVVRVRGRRPIGGERAADDASVVGRRTHGSVDRGVSKTLILVCMVSTNVRDAMARAHAVRLAAQNPHGVLISVVIAVSSPASVQQQERILADEWDDDRDALCVTFEYCDDSSAFLVGGYRAALQNAHTSGHEFAVFVHRCKPVANWDAMIERTFSRYRSVAKSSILVSMPVGKGRRRTSSGAVDTLDKRGDESGRFPESSR